MRELSNTFSDFAANHDIRIGLLYVTVFLSLALTAMLADKIGKRKNHRNLQTYIDVVVIVLSVLLIIYLAVRIPSIL
jgi:uncharacterized membrane protein YfcA